ncbi:MAG: KamA family protein, partial [Acidobacteriota bacterium]
MTHIDNLDKIGLSVRSHKLLKQLLNENPKLKEIMGNAKNETEALIGVRNHVLDELKKNPRAIKFYNNENIGKNVYEKLKWPDLAAIRILDYIDNAGRKFIDLNLRGKIAVSNPIKLIWLAVTYGTGGAKPDFFEDMLELFRQFRGERTLKKPGKEKLKKWMNRHASGLDPRIIKLREENRDRILKKIIARIDSGKKNDLKFKFEKGMSPEQKYIRALEWWDDWKFHLRFAVRTPEELNEMLGNSLDPDTMKILERAKRVGIPFFVNPYYLSLMHVRVPYYAIGADLSIRDYVIYTKPLIKEFGHIVAWEKEDKVIPGEPNAAGWILPSFHNVHRRYPEVAILIPDTVGRACGGLCASCQRMHDFQNGHLNFDLKKLRPKVSWKEKLQSFMNYFENDSQLRDILITGGDALMSSDKSLKEILDAIYNMAVRKRENNKNKKNEEKYAEILRVRLGSRLLAYIPQRITDDLVKILSDFRKMAMDAGIKQFVIQTHIQSPMEITPETERAVRKILDAGWIITNQHVYTISSSRRGHNL